MSAPNWQQLEEIFQRALDTDKSKRGEFLERACLGEPQMRREIETLLTQYEEAGDMLEGSAYDQSGLHELASLMESETDPLIGHMLGAYRVERELGRGGMGAVYLAERADDAFKRRVAIKVIKRGMDTDFILRRFRHERRILAALDHPNIARLLDGGATESGLPYFVMEYIEGQPLYAYCDGQRLDIRQRLRLFAQICDAVNYAHQLKIIHRDIKPNNILVTSAGVPKLFDFGIAKLLNPELAPDSAPMTATAMRMMTLDYASPEQVEGLPVTHLSDVYSLGVLLYELLTGHRPYGFRSRHPYEMSRLICEVPPESPSAVIDRDSNIVPTLPSLGVRTIEQVCEMRRDTLEGLRKELTGNLDRIVLKLLQKEPAKRYQTARALREDIERYLDGQPILAAGSMTRSHEPSTRTRTTHREQEPHVVSVAVLPFKILGVRDRSDTDEYLGVGLADALITRLSNVKRLVVRPTSSVLKYDDTGDPFEAGKQLAVNYIVDGNIRRAGETLRITVQLLHVEENAARWAGKFDERSTDVLKLEDLISEQVTSALIPQLTREEQLQLAKRGTDNPKAYAAYLRGRYFWNRFTPALLPRAIESFQLAIALDPDYALAHVGVADFYNWAGIYGILPPMECYEKAFAAATRALDLDLSLGEAHAALGLTIESRDWDWMEAERLYLRALELNPNYSLAHEWYSSALVGTGRFAEGIREIRKAEELDPLSARAMTLTAWTLFQAGEYKESLAKSEQLIELDRNYAQGHLQRALNLVQLGRAEEALPSYRQAVSLMPESVLPRYEMCFGLVAAGRVDEARVVLAEIEAFASRNYVKPYWLAMGHLALNDREKAFQWFETAFAEHDPWFVWFGTDPRLNRIKDDPRYWELLKRSGNPLDRSRQPKPA